jgi:hypothetical protein
VVKRERGANENGVDSGIPDEVMNRGIRAPAILQRRFGGPSKITTDNPGYEPAIRGLDAVEDRPANTRINSNDADPESPGHGF